MLRLAVLTLDLPGARGSSGRYSAGCCLNTGVCRRRGRCWENTSLRVCDGHVHIDHKVVVRCRWVVCDWDFGVVLSVMDLLWFR
jgi:hypothetical protein